MNRKFITLTALATVAVGWFTSTGIAQVQSLAHHMQDYALDAGLHDGRADTEYVAFEQMLTVPGARWLRIDFVEPQLGQRSRIVMTSMKDGAEQSLNASQLIQWKNHSAYFNGNSVWIQLVVAPGDAAITMKVAQVMVGDPSEGNGTEDVCGFDERTSTTSGRIGRIVPVGCTGWVFSNGAFLTAGHCVGANMDTLQFDVPASDCDGEINHPGPEDQYPIGTVVGFSTDSPGNGDDWAVFRVGQNAITGRTPVQDRGVFWRGSIDDSAPTMVTITGFGTDDQPGGCGSGTPDLNSDSQTLQVETDDFGTEDVQASNDVVLTYFVDTDGGNSGSPVILSGSSTTIGIHTNGGCVDPFVGNEGTGFENNDLETTMRNFTDTNVEFVDVGHPVTAALQSGNIFRPWDVVAEAVSAASSGATISIVAGDYTRAAGNTFIAGTGNKALFFDAPVGVVIIGN